ncbi:MAG TPA: hypothetical protein PKM65_20470 [Spirochaetota bacterium]|nr:hypothetical protein [Spirochaetota bacterium]
MPKVKKPEDVSIRIRCRDIEQKKSILRSMRRVRGVHDVKSIDIVLAGVKAIEGKGDK